MRSILAILVSFGLQSPAFAAQILACYENGGVAGNRLAIQVSKTTVQILDGYGRLGSKIKGMSFRRKGVRTVFTSEKGSLFVDNRLVDGSRADGRIDFLASTDFVHFLCMK